MTLQKYSKMKDSGIEWIGEIPEDWEVSKIKFVSNVTGRIGYRGYTINDIVAEGEGAITLSPSNIIDDKFDLSKKTYLSWEKYRESTEIQIFENDILLVKTGSTVGKVCIVTDNTEKMTINPQLVVLKPFRIIPKYLLFFMSSKKYKDQIYNSIVGGSTPTTSQQEILNHYVSFPTRTEQKEIVNYLDKQTKILDDEISKNKKLIELLKEKRQSVINHAVTKGLDDTVPMKESGIEWIGEIPESWNLTPLRYLLKSGSNGIKIGPFGSAITLDEMFEEGFKVYGQENIIKNDFECGERFINSDKFKKLNAYEVIPDDILITMMGSGTPGKANIVPKDYQKGIMDSHLVRLRPNELTIADFVSIVINYSKYVKIQVEMAFRGSTMTGLNSSVLKKFIICIPPKHEQKQIVDHIDEKTNKTNSLISKVELQIKQLQEFRESLISSAVTGKICVTN